MVTSLW